MITKSDFLREINNTISNYPEIEALYRLKDPRILQNIGAMATMLSMISAQIEVSLSEPFSKSRDSTVLADAAMKGVILKSKPSKVRIEILNGNNSIYSVGVGRVVIDSNGKKYFIDEAVQVVANSRSTFTATQLSKKVIEHTVSEYTPYYSIKVPTKDGDSSLASIEVRDQNGSFNYKEQYVNIMPDERVFHVESNERQEVYVRFGQKDVVATQPQIGTVISITIYFSTGQNILDAETSFAFEYINSVNDSLIELKVSDIVNEGQNPHSIETLREISRYPSVYDHSSVFMGEFNFLIAREYPYLNFFSVWNELEEEVARGANQDNINALFIAINNNDNDYLTEGDSNFPVSPEIIAQAMIVKGNIIVKQGILSGIQTSVLETITKADNSYKVKFVTPVLSKIGIEINATISTVYDSNEIKDKIKDVILKKYGVDSKRAGRSGNTPLYREIYSLLKKEVSATSDGDGSDLTVKITNNPIRIRPELWRFVDESSLVVNILSMNITMPSWNSVNGF